MTTPDWTKGQTCGEVYYEPIEGIPMEMEIISNTKNTITVSRSPNL